MKNAGKAQPNGFIACLFRWVRKKAIVPQNGAKQKAGMGRTSWPNFYVKYFIILLALNACLLWCLLVVGLINCLLSLWRTLPSL
jgi:hypothetical protein